MSSDRIALCEPLFTGNEWTYVKECLDTAWVSSGGAYVGAFEQKIAAFVGAPHAIATVNGTSAIHVALLAAGVERGDEVLVSSMTFIAPANAIAYIGAFPIFVDADPCNWQMDPALVVAFLHDECERRPQGIFNRRTGRRIGAIVPVHILGQPVDLDPILAAAAEAGIPVVEDATESLGASYKGAAVGMIGVAGCLSFNGNKLITTGGGGMVVTRDEAVARRVRHLTTQAKMSRDEYQHDEVGFNYRLTNVQAAIGVAQAERLPAYIAAKRRSAAIYDSAFANMAGVSPMPRPAHSESVAWLYTVEISGDTTGARDLQTYLASRGIETRPLWEPMHMSRAHRGAQALGGDVAAALYRNCLSLPSSVGLTDAQRAAVVEAIRTYLAADGVKSNGE